MYWAMLSCPRASKQWRLLVCILFDLFSYEQDLALVVVPLV
jgi:hypothetical protein